VHTFEWLAPLSVLLAYLARESRGTKTIAWLTVVLLALQYATAGSQGSLGRHGLAVLHPVSATLLFWAAIELARRARETQRRDSIPTVSKRPAAG
jgi:heme A synthase